MNNKPVSEEELKKIAETWDKEASKGLEKDWREEFKKLIEIHADAAYLVSEESYDPKIKDEALEKILSFISQIESSAQERTVRDFKEIIKNLKPSDDEAKGWEIIEKYSSCCPGDDAGRGYVVALKEIRENLQSYAKSKGITLE